MTSTSISRLKDVLAKPDTVVFVGAGLSAWSGLPSWRTLLTELAAFRDSLGLTHELVRREIEQADLLQAASFGFMDLTSAQRRDFLLHACRAESAVPSHAHQALLELAPRFFVTTNYDTLFEQALARYRPNEHYQIVTNRQPVDQPSLLRATASHFVFKPHGTVSDIESVILTREDYRRLANDWSYTLRTLRTLLVTRPVVFIGFGLRDPDFLLVRDAIAADYRGGVQDHYSLVLDPHPDEIRYWRDSYGLHLIGYPPSPPDEANRHQELLTVLEALSGVVNVAQLAPTPTDTLTSDQTLALIRLAARQRRLTDDLADSEEIPLRLHEPPTASRADGRTSNHFRSALYARALSHLNGPVFVFGPPGAGKTYGALRHIGRLADELSSACMSSEPVSWQNIVIPLFIQLRLYSGSLRDLVRQQLPPELRLQDFERVFIVFDGVNEVPQAYLDDNSFIADLEELLSAQPFISSTAVLLGRAMHESSLADALVLELDEIDREWLVEAMPNVTSPELLSALSRPIVYRLVRDGIVSLADIQTPADIYASYFNQLIDLLPSELRPNSLRALALAAFETVSDGTQTTPYLRLVSRLSRRHERPDDLAARLVSLEFLRPVTDARVTFLHHSFLDYLAAIELLRRETATPGSVTELSAHRSWDYVTLFAASLAPDGDARRGVVQQLLEVDLVVAVRALLYSGQASPSVISDVLTALHDYWPDPTTSSFQIEDMARRLPVYQENYPAIERLLAHPSSACAVGVSLALRLNTDAWPVATDCILRHADNYNICVSIGRSLAPFVTIPLLNTILSEIASYGRDQGIDWAADHDEDRRVASLVDAVAAAARNLGLENILRAVDPASAAGLHLQVLSRLLFRIRTTTEGFEATLILLRRGEAGAVLPFYGYLRFPGAGVVNDLVVGADVVETLVRFASAGEISRWAAESLLLLSQIDPSSRNIIEDCAGGREGILGLIFRLSSTGSTPATEPALVESVLLQELDNPDAQWQLVGALDLDWTRFANLFEQIVRSDNFAAISAVGEEVQGKDLPPVDVSNVEMWLDQLVTAARRHPWAAHVLARLLGRVSGPSDQRRFAQAIDSLPEETRRLATEHLLPELSAITTDDLSGATISLLLSMELSRGQPSWKAPLATLATERFVEETLLPILVGTLTPTQRSCVAAIVDSAGKRHGRRYTGSDGRIIG